jgi:acyl-CoA synthetase (AMP-forming)/AMP-acid ligase II
VPRPTALSTPSAATAAAPARDLTAPLVGGSLVGHLAAYGDRTALLGAGAGEGLTYADLAGRVAAFARRLGTARRLVLVEGDNHTDALVAHLGSLAAGCPVLLTAPAAAAGLVDAYDPDVLWSRDTGLVERRREPRVDLHPDLALLLSTSGTTGSPKLVRLSRDNLLANARSIADYLDLTDRDVAPTVLPMHYCYGLSVVHSHLLAGASLLLTDDSVVDPSFWDDVRRHRATSLAGVPYTFELLDRVGFADMDLPHLRYLTQAGGRLAPDDVRRWAALGRERGWDLVVMYGQTEATARMAWLPPLLALDAPGSIGIPVPGGSFTVEPLPERPFAGANHPEVGELVYHGPNVMLGYAETPADLALGRTVTSLRTGDIGRQRDDGLFEVVGRRSRVAKVFGLRIDLDHVEQLLAARGVVAAAADGGDRLVLAVCAGAAAVDVTRVAALVRDELGLAPSGVVVVTPAEMPRLPSGKTDYRSVLALAAGAPAEARTGVDAVALVGGLLRRPDATAEDTFVGLGGDSLSYVEVSLRLEQALGTLPADWPNRPLGSLGGGPRRRGTRVETGVLLRALGIVAIVGTHANLFALAGGAHVLLGVLGFNFARFHLRTRRAERTRHVARAAARIAVPSAAVIGLASLWNPGLGWRQALLLNGVLGPASWTEPAWHYWFIEVALVLMLGTAALLAVPAVDRWCRAAPFWTPFALAVAGLVFRFEILEPRGGDDIHRAHMVFWLFALGWAAATATTVRHRVLLSLVAVVAVPGFFDDPHRELLVLAGLLALFWVPAVRLPHAVARAVAVLAAASMWIYLLHWQVYPWFEDSLPWLATALGLGVGVAGWRACELARSRRASRNG